ncbi:MAG TPA: ATP-binding protein [Opitutaceae bacterium]|nr:ATP-binding protein [Opitutaceae bacterium]
MKTSRGKPTRPAPTRHRADGTSHSPGPVRSRRADTRVAPKSGDLARLRARLDATEQALRAIRNGEVDAVVVGGKDGDHVFTREGAEHSYRLLIESMNEGALTLTNDKVILYANQCFARMVKCPLERVTGGSFRRFLGEEDLDLLRPLIRRATKAGTKLQVDLHADDGTWLPAQISIRRLTRGGQNRMTVSMVVTDLTEPRRTEELLRALTHRIVQVQEVERERVARELHDNITQLLCAVLFRSQALVESLSGREGPARKAAKRLHAMLGETVGEVERISRELRPEVLNQLGLVAAIRSSSNKFASRTGVAVKLTGMQLPAELPADVKLALYRIFQEAFRNVEKHAGARRVTVNLIQRGNVVELVIRDDGAGFDARHHEARRDRKVVLGLLGMRERATAVGGTLMVKSAPHAGTEIIARIPVRAP